MTPGNLPAALGSHRWAVLRRGTGQQGSPVAGHGSESPQEPVEHLGLLEDGNWSRAMVLPGPCARGECGLNPNTPSALGDVLGKPRGCEHACFSPAACRGLCRCSRTPLAPLPALHLQQSSWLQHGAVQALGLATARGIWHGVVGEPGPCRGDQGSRQDPSLTCFGSPCACHEDGDPHRGLCNHPWSSGLAPSTGEATGRVVLHNVGGGAPAETERRQQPDPGGAHAGNRERLAAVTSAAFCGFSYAVAPRGVPGSPAAVSGAVSLASMRLFCPSAARRRCLGVGCGPTGDALRRE